MNWEICEWYLISLHYDKISWLHITFSHSFTNCDSFPAIGTFGISSVNNFLTTGCIKVIDVSSIGFDLLVKESFFRFFEKVLTLCCIYPVLLNFYVEIAFRYYVETDFGIYYGCIGLHYLVSPHSNSALRHAVYFDCAVGLFGREIFLANIFKVSNDFFLDFSISII